MKKKLFTNISELVLDDQDFFCYINPFNNKKNISYQKKSESLSNFMEKKNRINKISIKIKNRDIKHKLSSLATKRTIGQEKEEEEKKKENIKFKSLSPTSLIKKIKIKLIKIKTNSEKSTEFPNLIPLSLKKSKSSFRINFFNDYEKYFFSDNDYSGLKYDVSEIFKNKSKYKKIIIEKINILKKGLFDKKTIKLEKRFLFGKDKIEINLTLSTLTISLEDMLLPPTKQNNNLKLNLPISLLPLFYFKGINTFQKLLSAIVKVENNFEKIYFDEKAFEIALRNISDFRTRETNDIRSNSSVKNIKDEDLKSPVLKRNSNFLNFNHFIFFWVSNTRSLSAKITLPCIHLDILNYNISLKNFIDYELLFFLFEKNFEHWEFYIIKYLSTYSKYRNIFEQLGTNDKINNQTFFLKEPKTKMNTFSQEVLYNMYTDKNNINQVMEFNSFYIIVNLIDEAHFLEKNYRIFFSFFQYVKLYEIAKYSNKISFLSKFLEIDTETHSLNFNFKEYDEFDANIWMENMKKFSGASIRNTDEDLNEELFNEFEVFNKKIKIEYKKPLWRIIKMENKKEIIRTWEIGKEMEIYLIESILNPLGSSWNKFLNECLKKIDEPYEEIVPFIPLPIKKRLSKHYK